jgi:hypothetical protein
MAVAAQTNLQLYRQLTDQGAAPSDLAAVRRAYDLASSLFAGLYRASGKPFVAHVVGTASVLAAQRAPLPLVTAGLLHAAYVQGTFGDGPPGRTRRRAERLIEAIGGEAERLVSRYATLPWKAGDLSAFRNLPASLDSLDRDVLTIRLANEVEELIDYGVLHHGDAERRREEAVQALPVWISWASAISADGIALALEAARAQLVTFQAPDELRTDRVRSYRPPPVARPTLASGTRLALRRIRGVLRRLGVPPGKTRP